MSTIFSDKIEMGAFVNNALVETFSKIFVVNVNTGEFEVFKNDGLLDDIDMEDCSDIFAFMQKLITGGYVYPEHVTACRRFTNPEYVRKSLFSGDKRIVQSYRRRTAKGDKWITFAIIANSCGPENPIAIYTWREADSDAITLLDSLPTISSMYDKLIRINLSNNADEPGIVDAAERERLVGGVINMYEWWAGYSKDGNIATDDMGAFGTLTKSGSLQKRFAEDPTPVNFRYRRKVGDEYRWVQLEIAPSVEYSEENQIMLLSLKDIHDEYTAQLRSRQELIDSMNRDALTGLFNRLKFNSDTEKLKESDSPIFTCLYVDVNGLHELNNLLGHQKGDEMLRCVANTLREYFPNEQVYRIGGDEFVVTSTNLTKDEVRLAVGKVRSDLLQHNYEVSIGVQSGACGENIEEIVAEAELEMRNDKEAYYLRNGDRRRKRQMNEELEQLLMEKRDNERFLEFVTRQFSGVYSVALATDRFRPIYDPNLFAELLKQSDDSFIGAMRLYLEGYVKKEYHDRFDDLLDFDKLDEKLRKGEVVEITFYKMDGSLMILRVLEIERKPKSKAETIWMIWKKYE